MYGLSRTPCEQMDTGARRAAERAKVVAAGECPAFLLDLGELAFLMRSNGMLFIYHPARGAFVNAFENLTYDEVVAQGLFDFGWGRRLEPGEVRLPRQARNLPGYAHQAPEAPGYGFGDEWRENLRARGLLPPKPPGAADDASIKQSSSPAFCAPAVPVMPEESASQATRVLDLKRFLRFLLCRCHDDTGRLNAQFWRIASR